MRLGRLLSASAVGYLLGTVPSADLAARATTGGRVDLRTTGSGNPGGTNAGRVLGRAPGRAVKTADVAKGFVACALGRTIAGDAGAHVAGVAAVAGHCYPLWRGFRGGRGVATSFGQCLYTMPAYAPVDALLAFGVARIPGLRRPAFAAVAVSSLAWLVAGVLANRHGKSRLWEPRPSGLLPLANAASVGVIAIRSVPSLLRGDPDELSFPP